jgi:hypothetical protein
MGAEKSKTLSNIDHFMKNSEIVRACRGGNRKPTLIFQETRIKVACVITTLIQITINVYTSSQDA